MTLFGQKIPPELLIAAPAFNGFYTDGNSIANALVLFAIVSSVKKPWEYDD